LPSVAPVEVVGVGAGVHEAVLAIVVAVVVVVVVTTFEAAAMDDVVTTGVIQSMIDGVMIDGLQW
jgi:hypothetical protein